MMDMKFKAAFFDIDNTLYDYSKMRFTESTLECIKKFQKNGGKAFIVSARCYDLIRSFGLFDLGVKWDGWSSFCGGVTPYRSPLCQKAFDATDRDEEDDRLLQRPQRKA